MLRSIFSLIQRIIDSSEKKYNNTKSKAVIYCFTNPDDTVNMNLEVSGKNQKSMKSLQQKENERIEAQKENSFSIETEHGDVVTCKHKNQVKIVPKGSKDEVKNRVTFSNDEIENLQTDREVDAEVQPNVRDLIDTYPTKRVDLSLKGTDQISVLLEQIQKMKTGLERLQEIALQFNCSERFGEDINYLINNVKPHLQRSRKTEADKNDISPKS